MISHDHQCIFVHIPKTGGSSICNVIWPAPSTSDLWMGFVDMYHNKYQTGGLQHLLARHIQTEVGSPVFFKYYKFTIVRNPWDKAVSQFAYMKKRKDLCSFIGMKQGDGFKKYLELIVKTKHVQWEPQVNFIFGDQDQCMVDYIGRYESFTESVFHIFATLGIQRTEIMHMNKGERDVYQEYYDSESRELVADMYSEDIRTLGYSYD